MDSVRIRKVTVMIDNLYQFTEKDEGVERIYITEKEGEPVKCTIACKTGYRKVFPKRSIVSYEYQL